MKKRYKPLLAGDLPMPRSPERRWTGIHDRNGYVQRKREHRKRNWLIQRQPSDEYFAQLLTRQKEGA